MGGEGGWERVVGGAQRLGARGGGREGERTPISLQVQ